MSQQFEANSDQIYTSSSTAPSASKSIAFPHISKPTKTSGKTSKPKQPITKAKKGMSSSNGNVKLLPAIVPKSAKKSNRK